MELSPKAWSSSWKVAATMPTPHLLLVDDSPTIRNILRIYLMNLGCQLHEADSGLTALAVLDKHPISLVISDINMPGMDGLALVRKIRADTRASVRSLPVLMLTGEKDEQLLRAADELKVEGRIKKPVSATDLVREVKRVLDALAAAQAG
jgi:two-component system, chemotaxis family, chemotaxis protein CheY